MALNYVVNHSTLKTNLVSWWPLNEYSAAAGAVTRYDAHGSNDLTDNNTTASAAGQWNRGADFELTNTEYLKSSTGPGITGDWSVSFWIKPESVSANMWVLSSYTSGDGGFLTRVNSDGKLFAQFGNGANSAKTTTTASHISAGNWYHVVITSDVSAGANGYTIYVNGSSVALTAGTDTATSPAAQADVTISGIGTGTQCFDGIVQDAAIWSKILSTDEIADLYNSGAGMTYGIDFDVATTYSENPYSSPYSFSHTCTGTNRLLIVHCLDNMSDSVTGVTYNGDSMTQIGSSFNTATNIYISMWGLLNPASGSNTVAVTSSSSSSWLGTIATSYIGASQSALPSNTATNSQTATSISGTLTVSDYSWIVGSVRASSSGATSAGTGTIQRASNGTFTQAYDSIRALTAGSQSITATSTSQDLNIFVMEVEPVQVAAASTFTPKVMFF